MNFGGVKSLQIPEGNVKKITRGDLVLWKIRDGAVLFRTEKLTNKIRYRAAAASNEYYATITGGTTIQNATITVEGIDKDGTNIAIPALGTSKHSHDGTGFGDYLIYGGGCTIGSESGINVTSSVDVYDSELTKISAKNLSKSRSELMAAHNNSYAVFAGGRYKSTSSASYLSNTNITDAYDKELTRTETTISVNCSRYASARVGDYAVVYKNAFDDTLTRTTLSMSINERNAAATYGDIALFGGGGSDSAHYNTVYAVDESLTVSEITSMSVARYEHAAAFAGGFVLFGGGVSESRILDTVDVYDGQLTRTGADNLSQQRYKLAASGVGNFAVFAYGENTNTIDNNGSASWDIYKI